MCVNMCQYTLFDVGGVEIHSIEYCTNDQSNVKYVEDTLQIIYRFQCIKCYVCQRHWRWYLRLLCNTAYRVMLLILLLRAKVSSTMYCILYTGPLAPPGGKACTAFHLVEFSGLPPVILGLQGWLQARCTSNPQFLN